MEKGFKKTLFGFNKADVNSYVAKMLDEFDAKIKQLENENSRLKRDNEEIVSKYETLCSEREKILKDKERIAEAIINANEKAEIIVEQAKQKAIEERNMVHELVESEKEKLVDIKERIRLLSKTVSDTLKVHEDQLNNIVENDDERE